MPRGKSARRAPVEHITTDHGRWMLEDFSRFCQETRLIFPYSKQPHDEMCAEMEYTALDETRRTQRKKLYLAPRGSFKTSLVVARIIFLLLKYPQIKLLLYRSTRETSQQMLREVKGHLMYNDMIIDNFGDLSQGTAKWDEDAIVIGTRKIAPGDRDPSVMTIGTDGQTAGFHPDGAFMDDVVTEQNCDSPQLMDKAWRIMQSVYGLLPPWGWSLVTGCFASGTPILRSDGTWRAIEDLKVGEMVRTQHGDNPVEAVIDQGVAETVVVRTKRASWRCTPNHPFLVLRGKLGKKPEWIEASKLTKGDRLVTREKTDYYSQVPWTPDERPFDIQDAYLFGVLMGDGWCGSAPRPYICVAGSDEELPQYLERLGRYGNAYIQKDHRYVRIDSIWGAWFHERGVAGGAKNKRFQPWVFQLPVAFQREVLRGLCDADGHWHRLHPNLCDLEISNSGLIDDVRSLAKTCGIHATLARHRSRTSYIKMRNKSYESELYATALNFDPARNRDNDWVKSVEPGVTQKVWDLTIKDDPCYVANGVVVHNTRWSAIDCYQKIIDINKQCDEAEVPRAYDEYIRTVYVPNLETGEQELFFPSRLSQEFIESQRNNPALEARYFESWYFNRMVDPRAKPFKMADLKWFDCEYSANPYKSIKLTDPEYAGEELDLYVAMIVDPAQTANVSSDAYGITIVGFDANRNFIVLESRELIDLPSNADHVIFDLLLKYEPDLLSIESSGGDAGLVSRIGGFIERNSMRTLVRGYSPLQDEPRGKRSKPSRINAMEPYVSKGYVWIRRGYCNELVRQLDLWPSLVRDDVIDSWARARHVLLKYVPDVKETAKRRLDETYEKDPYEITFTDKKTGKEVSMGWDEYYGNPLADKTHSGVSKGSWTGRQPRPVATPPPRVGEPSHFLLRPGNGKVTP